MRLTLFTVGVLCIFLCVNVSAGAPVKASRKLNVEFSFPKNAKKQSKYRIIITNHPAAFGELQAAKRIAKAISNLGWEWAIIDRIDQQPEYIKQLKPDFVISLREEIKPVGGVPHFLYLHVPMFMYLNKDGSLCTRAYPNILLYDGFLEIVPKAEPVRTAYIQEHNKPYYSIKTFFSVPKTAFKATPKKRLCYWGSTWDKARGGKHYQSFYTLLDKTNYFDLYGPAWAWEKMNLKSYRGTLVIDDYSLVEKISECGIALILHSHEHIRGGVPTSRIFEAAAASAVIICDKHPFVEKEFGDSVLYVDPNQTPEKVFQQIDTHVKWVHANPKKAIALARRSYQIFIERFTLESEVLKIAKMYEDMRVKD